MVSKSKVALFLIIIMLFSSVVSATMNVAVITDPTGKDPNGCAAGSQSFASNMFQSTFIFSQEHKMALLSGGEGTSDVRVTAIISALTQLQNNGTPSEVVSVAQNYEGIRLMAVNPTQGIAVGGDFEVYVITVDNNSTVKVQAASGGIATVPAGTKGAIIHLRNSEGNPKAGTADTVRLQTAMNIGKMIRDGYPATTIVAEAFGEVARDSGEDHGGGAINLVSGVTTGDMFTPEQLNDTGYEMEQPYSKVSSSGWSVGYPEADNYQVSPVDGSPLTVVYAYEALGNAITVSDDNPSVSTYGSDEKGISEATTSVVNYAVRRNGYDPVKIAQSINKAIDSGSIIGVEYVDSSDINVKENIKAVGVYYTPTANGRSSPSWDLPLDSSIFDILGNIQSVIGILLILLALFRSTLIKSFFRRR
ncbi:membrane protein [Methanosphaera sp. WGK6]|nr:membrane protein [Methanosphaera sp. WGK6]